MKCYNCSTKNSKIMALTRTNYNLLEYAPCKKCGVDLVNTDNLGRLLFTFFVLPIILIFFIPYLISNYMDVNLWYELIIDFIVIIPTIVISLPWKYSKNK